MKRKRNFPPDEDVPSHDSAPKISASDVNRLFINILLVPVQRAFERQYARESNTSHAHACFMRVRLRMPGSQAKLECNVVIIPKILKLYFRAFLFLLFVLFCFIIIIFSLHISVTFIFVLAQNMNRLLFAIFAGVLILVDFITAKCQEYWTEGRRMKHFFFLL